jgi:hypothetical protein
MRPKPPAQRLTRGLLTTVPFKESTSCFWHDLPYRLSLKRLPSYNLPCDGCIIEYTDFDVFFEKIEKTRFEMVYTAKF